jgi:hypothetical protein
MLAPLDSTTATGPAGRRDLAGRTTTSSTFAGQPGRDERVLGALPAVPQGPGAEAAVLGDVGDPLPTDARPGDELGVVPPDDARGDRVGEHLGELDRRMLDRTMNGSRAVEECGLRRRVGRRGGQQLGHGPAQLVGGVEEDVGGDAPRPALDGVVADAVVDGGDGRGRPLVGVAEGPPSSGECPRAREQQLEEHPGGEIIARDCPAHQGQQHAVGVGRVGGADEALDIAERHRPAGRIAHVLQPPPRPPVGAQPPPLVVQQIEHASHRSLPNVGLGAADDGGQRSPGMSPVLVTGVCAVPYDRVWGRPSEASQRCGTGGGMTTRW